MSLAITKRDAVRVCRKLGLDDKSSKRGNHFKYAYTTGGKQRTIVIIPRGRGSLKIKTVESIRRQFMLGKADFKNAVDCPYKSEDYEAHIKALVKSGAL